MKQTISLEDFESLSDHGQQALLSGFHELLNDFVYSKKFGLGTRQQLLNEGEDDLYLLPSIGQLLEYLDDHGITIEFPKEGEYIDVLWQSTQQILEG